MSEQTVSRVTIKLFVGCQLSSEIRMHLNQSKLWKQAAINPQKNSDELIEVRFHGKDYLGYYLDDDYLSVSELKIIENLIAEKLHLFCPSFDLSNIVPCAFAQQFIA